MPADAGIQHIRPRRLHRAGEGCDVVPGLAVGDQVDQADAVDEQAVRAERRADPCDHLDGQAHPVFLAATPGVGAAVGAGGEELVQEIPLGPHHLDPVIARLARPGRGGGNGVDLRGDSGVVQVAGREGRDRRLERRGGDAVGGIGVAARVQDLHRDPAALGMHRVGHAAVVGDVGVGEQACRPGEYAPFAVGRHAPRHDQPRAAPGPRGVEGRDPAPVAGFFQPRVHGSHEDAVGQGQRPEPDGRQKVRIGGVRHGGLPCLRQWRGGRGLSRGTRRYGQEAGGGGRCPPARLKPRPVDLVHGRSALTGVHRTPVRARLTPPGYLGHIEDAAVRPQDGTKRGGCPARRGSGRP